MARRKTDAERGRFGAWAYNTRIALDLSVEAVIAMLPTTYHPATLRKPEGGTVLPGLRMWRELGNLYTRLADEKHVAIDPQPSLTPEPVGATETPADIASAIWALVTEMRLTRAAQVESTDVLLRAMASVVGSQVPSGTSPDSEPVAPAGTGR